MVTSTVLRDSSLAQRRERVCVIGSGSWGTVVSKILACNIASKPELTASFQRDVVLWVYDEKLDSGMMLSEAINTLHENPKYMPGLKIPTNVRAEPDLSNAVRDTTYFVFVVPHQFVRGICKQIKATNQLNVERAHAISLIKGVDSQDGKMVLVSEMVKEELGLSSVSVLMGANIASEVALECFCEATLGCTSEQHAGALLSMFDTFYFRVRRVDDVAGVELCGALKNIIAFGAGFVDGLGQGSNTKAAIIRIGLNEMSRFAKRFYAGVRDETFLESCGVADLITTCYGGRNRLVAEAMVRTRRPLAELEEEMLRGQKLQGPPAAREVHEILTANNLCAEFPLLEAVYKITFEGANPDDLVRMI